MNRFGAADCYATSLLVAEAVAVDSGGRLDHVIMVSGEGWHDAVVGAGVAGLVGGAVLLTPFDGLREDALGILRRVGASEATVVAAGEGPEMTVSPGVFAELDEAGLVVRRLGGADRYRTSVAVARGMAAQQQPAAGGKAALIANGEVFADALVAGPLSARGSIPVLLSERDVLPAAVAGFLSDAGIERVVLLGGTAALSAGVESRIAGMGIAVERLAGATRFETAILTGQFAAGLVGGGCFAGDGVGLARGGVPFDAFSAAPLLGRRCAPLVLTNSDGIPASTAGYLDSLRNAAEGDVALMVFGGNAAVSRSALDAYLDVEVDSGMGMGRSDDLSGPYRQVAVGRAHGCALRSDRTVVCWGLDEEGQASPPTGEFRSLHVTGDFSCGIRTDDSIACWGPFYLIWANYPRTPKVYRRVDRQPPPQGEFAEIAGNGSYACGLRVEGSVACWGANARQRNQPPPSSYTAMAVRSGQSCGLRTDRTVACWGLDTHAATAVPEGEFTTVISASNGNRGLRTDGTAECWRPSGLPPVPPEGRFAELHSGGSFLCGLRHDGTIACAGRNDYGQSTPPQGTFATLHVGAAHACAQRPDRTIACWGDNDHDQTTLPD